MSSQDILRRAIEAGLDRELFRQAVAEANCEPAHIQAVIDRVIEAGRPRPCTSTLDLDDALDAGLVPLFDYEHLRTWAMAMRPKAPAVAPDITDMLQGFLGSFQLLDLGGNLAGRIHEAMAAVARDLHQPSVVINASPQSHTLSRALAGMVRKHFARGQQGSITDKDIDNKYKRAVLYSFKLQRKDETIQLELPWAGDDSIYKALPKLVRPPGVRAWATLLHLAALKGDSSGSFVWNLDEHLEAAGYRRNKRDGKTREKIAGLVHDLLEVRLVAVSPRSESGMVTRVEEPLITRDGAELLIKDGERAPFVTHGMRLKISPLFYSKESKSYLQFPREFLSIDESKRPHAHTLGFRLAIHLRWCEDAGAPLRNRVKELAEWAGIPARRRGGDAAIVETLRATLDILVKHRCIGAPIWETPPGREPGLDDFVAVPLAGFSRDRWIHRLAPTRAASPSIMAGADLRAWREGRGLTQGAAATLLPITERALRAAEKSTRRPSRKIRESVDALERGATPPAQNRKKSGGPL